MNEPGYEHYTEIAPDYIDRLAATWPEPREQLHIGGWNATYDMVRLLDLDTAEHALDLCCGEGGTARWLAATYKRHVSGVDILESAIAFARRKAEEQSVADLARFEVANVFKLPFADATFDVIYGQDPDGLAHYQRVHIFEECMRVLQPAGRLGFQLWIPNSDMPQQELALFEQVTIDVGFPSMQRLSAADFVHDMEQAGFENIERMDLSAMYQRHMEGIERIANEHEPGSLDQWTQMVLKLMRNGHKIGVGITARRPQ